MDLFDWYYTNYLTNFSRVLMAFIYLPILLLIGFRIYRQLKWKRWLKLTIITTAITIAYYAPVADTMLTGLDMRYYCNNEHGEHIYETANTDSVYGSIVGPEDYLSAGFTFVETEGYAGKLTRFELTVDGVIRTLIDTPVSEYEIKEDVIFLENNIRMQSYQIVNRATQKTLGEIKDFTAGYGWLDRATPDWGVTIFRCDKPPALGSYRFAIQVLKTN